MAEAYFDQVATQWDEMRTQFFDERVRTAAISKADVRTRQRVLDLGAGTGFVSEGLLAAGADVVAVDESPAMVGQLRSKFGGRVDARQGDAAVLPFPTGTFDAAFANMYLHHAADPGRAIAEAARVLKPGGKLVITDLDAHEHAFMRDAHHDRWMGFQRDDVARWFREAGLEDVAVESTAECCCTTSSCGTQTAKVSIFLAYGRR